jgi:GTPase SAR1 family protein
VPITRGKQSIPWFVILYGSPGVGKTTLASRAPDPVFLDLEDGTALLDVARIKPETTIKDTLRELYTADFKTLVIDSLTSFERVHTTETCAEKGWTTVESLDYGRSKKIWRQEFTESITKLVTAFRAKGRNVLLVAHSKVREVSDPVSQQTYDRFELDCDKEIHAPLISQVDGIFLLKQKTLIKDDKAIGNGSRILLTQDRPQYVAKSRWDIPEQIENPDHTLWALLDH